MEIQKISDAVTQRIKSEMNLNASKVDENLAWLIKEMHPLFFTLNQAEVEALSLLATSLHHMNYHKRLM